MEGKIDEVVQDLYILDILEIHIFIMDDMVDNLFIYNCSYKNISFLFIYDTRLRITLFDDKDVYDLIELNCNNGSLYEKMEI